MYISWRDSAVQMPQLQLVAVKRLTLSPGQTVTTTLNVSSDQLRVWDDDKAFVLTPGYLQSSTTLSFGVANNYTVTHLLPLPRKFCDTQHLSLFVASKITKKLPVDLAEILRNG